MQAFARALSSLGLVLGSLSFAAGASAAVWSNAGFAIPPRNSHAAERLTDGRVLVTGGAWADGNYTSSVIFDPKTGAWSTTGDMAAGRALHCMALLHDGRVLVAGGASKALDGSLASAEIWSPTTGTWSPAPPMKTARFYAPCMTMKDGRVLVVGGAPTADTDSAVAEIFDPTTSTWTSAPSMAYVKHNPRAALLPSGHVVVVGQGWLEEYDPTANTWAAPVSLGTLTKPTVAVLENGLALVVGAGSPGSALYDPTTHALTPTAPTQQKNRGASRVVALHGGGALAVGGVDDTGTELATAERFDAATKTWTATDSLPDRTALLTATPLADGRVLVVAAGKSLAMPAQLFNGVDGTKCDGPDQCISGYCTDGVCCNRPCGGACEACDLPGSEGTCGAASGTPRTGHSTCAPYVTCDKGACVQTCSSDAECSTGNVCFTDRKKCGPDRDLCGPNDTVVDRKTGQSKPCAPYACGLLGACLTSCATSLDCASGNLCQDGTCVAVPTGDAGGSSGGCSTGGARTGGAFALLPLLAALGLARRRRRARLSAAALLASLLALSCGCDAGAPRPEVARTTAAVDWSPAGAMKEPVRIYHSATALADGRVLVVGGGGATVLGSAELFDPATVTWSPAAPLAYARYGHDATALADGRVLVSGGRDATNKQLTSAELYDPAANAWSKSTMAYAREGHVAVRLADGRVLVAGGSTTSTGPLSSAELFDPTSNTWSATSSMASKRALAAAALLGDGRVLVVGGDGALDSSEIWDPASGAWSPGPAPATPRQGGTLLRVNASTLVLVGGNGKAVDVLDEHAMTFRAGASLAHIRFDSPAVLLGNGLILLAGGIASTTGSGDVYDDFQTYDPKADAWSSPRRMTVPRFAHTATVLGSQRVIVVGGLGTSTGSIPVVGPPELLNLPQGTACTKHEECSSGFCVDGFCCDRWCGAACEACNLAGKEGTCSPVTGAPRVPAAIGPKRASCAPYGACIEGICASSCANDGYCDGDHVCDVASQSCVEPIATCDGTSTVTDKSSGATKDCAPYKCQKNGACLAKCTTSDDCAGGALCNGNTCVVPASSNDSGGCSYGASPSAHGPLFALSMLTMVVACARRRRARRRPPRDLCERDERQRGRGAKGPTK